MKMKYISITTKIHLMKNIIYATVIICLIGLLSDISAQTIKTGTTAAQVLKVGIGPRAVAMGGAYTSVSDDIVAMYWNPAGLANINTSEVVFSHTSLYADLGFDYAAFATDLSGLGTIGASVTFLSVDEMMVRTIENPEGTGEFFDVGSFSIGLSYARNLTDNFSIGFNVKYVDESIYNMSATGFAIDIGTLYKIPVLNELRIASSISNFGTKMRLEGRDALVITPSGASGDNLLNSNLELDYFDMPLLFRVGVSADIVKMQTSRLTVAVDAIHPNDHTEYINTGFEYAWNEMVYLRGGWNALFEKDTEKGLTLGVGLKNRLADYVTVKFDYAYGDYGRLSEAHYFSLGLML